MLTEEQRVWVRDSVVERVVEMGGLCENHEWERLREVAQTVVVLAGALDLGAGELTSRLRNVFGEPTLGLAEEVR